MILMVCFQVGWLAQKDCLLENLLGQKVRHQLESLLAQKIVVLEPLVILGLRNSQMAENYFLDSHLFQDFEVMRALLVHLVFHTF